MKYLFLVCDRLLFIRRVIVLNVNVPVAYVQPVLPAFPPTADSGKASKTGYTGSCSSSEVRCENFPARSLPTPVQNSAAAEAT